MEIAFLLPAGPLQRAGGGATISHLAAALRAAGHGVSLQAGGLPLPGRLTVVDGLALPSLPPDSLAHAVGLIHHPTALAPAAEHDAVRAAERERLPRLSRVVATSNAVGKRLATEFGLSPEQVRVVEPGVPEAPRSEGTAGCNILSVGALVPRKGYPTLLRALARLFDLTWTLTIVGETGRDPNHAAALREQAQAMPGRVHFAGPLDDAALEAAWRATDLFALATEWEGYCAPVSEALRRGIPVAVTSGGAAAERVTAETGVVCAPGDVDQLSKAMRRQIFDTALRAEMAQAAWQLGQTLPSWATQAALFLEAIT